MDSNEDTQLQQAMNTTASSMNTQVKMFPWERCPAEIKDMIFDLVASDPSTSRDYFKCKGTVIPPLVEALRPLNRSYEQVLRRFGSCNSTICLNRWTGYDFRKWSNDELKAIRVVNIELTLVYSVFVIVAVLCL